MTLEGRYRAYNQIPPTMTVYSFYKTEKTPKAHGLRFDDQIPNAEALIAVVTYRNLQRYNVTILDRRKS